MKPKSSNHDSIHHLSSVLARKLHPAFHSWWTFKTLPKTMQMAKRNLALPIRKRITVRKNYQMYHHVICLEICAFFIFRARCMSGSALGLRNKNFWNKEWVLFDPHHVIFLAAGALDGTGTRIGGWFWGRCGVFGGGDALGGVSGGCDAPVGGSAWGGGDGFGDGGPLGFWSGGAPCGGGEFVGCSAPGGGDGLRGGGASIGGNGGPIFFPVINLFSVYIHKINRESRCYYRMMWKSFGPLKT